MEEYKSVNVSEYTRFLLASGVIPIQAEKFARIIARKGEVGETVISWSVDSEGHAIKEKESQVVVDEKTGNPGWIVTKVDEVGNIIVDENGHSNQWIIEDSTFQKKYELDPENAELYRPKGGKQLFIQITDNIVLNQWGSDMKIAAGGYINITNAEDMYGISNRDFEDTYRITDEFSKTK